MSMDKYVLIVLLDALLLLACSSNGGPQGIAYISNEDSGTISIVDLSDPTRIDSVEVGKRPRGIRLSPDGQMLYVALSGSPKCPPWVPEHECAMKVADKSADGIAEIDLKLRQIIRILPGGSDPEQFDITVDGNYIFVSNEDNGKVSVVDVLSGKLIKQLEVGEEPEGVRVSPDQKWVLITNEADNNISVIDVQKLEVVAEIEVGARPRDICYYAKNNRAYISNELSNSVSVIDLDGLNKLDDITIPEGALPMGLALDEDSQTLYVSGGRGKKIYGMPLSTKGQHKEVIAGQRPWGIALTADKRYVVTANGPSDDISIIDVKNFKIVSRISVGENPWGVIIGEH